MRHSLAEEHEPANPSTRPEKRVRFRDRNPDPKLCKWWSEYQTLLRLGDDRSRRADALRKKWRRRFRVPIPVFHQLLEMCQEMGVGVKTASRAQGVAS